MRLFVKEKLLSLHDRYYIYNENDEVEYEIESKMISIGDKTTIYDKNHNEIAYIEEKILHFMPHYNVYINGEFNFEIKKKFNVLKNDYELSNMYTVDGNMFNLLFSIKNPVSEEIALVSKKFLTLGDQYQIDILDEKDIIVILTIIVAITNDVDRAQRNNN